VKPNKWQHVSSALHYVLAPYECAAALRALPFPGAKLTAPLSPLPAPYPPVAVAPLFALPPPPPPLPPRRYAFLDGCLEFAQIKHLHPLCDALDGFLFLRFSFYAAPEQARPPASYLPPPASPPLLACRLAPTTHQHACHAPCLTPLMPLALYPSPRVSRRSSWT
jgi:hypothetical protein